MNTNIRCLIAACEATETPYEVRHHAGNLLQVSTGGSKHVFVNLTTPLNLHSMAKLSQDKEFCYQLCHPLVAMPRTVGFLSPFVKPGHRKYLQYTTMAQIADAITSEFDLPCIVKRNRGSMGNHVFLCHRPEEVGYALERIFNIQHKNYDYIALAQPYIRAKQEYRVIILDGEIQFAYLKNNAHAVYQDNLSPLHWEHARAELVRDPDLLASMSTFLHPLCEESLFIYAGLDLIRDHRDQWWLLEVNSAPGFEIFVRHNGPEQVVELYKNMLDKLSTRDGVSSSSDVGLS